MKLAIIVPYKNRPDYLRIFLQAVPRYLEGVNRLKNYRIYIAEQTSPDVFNLSTSRNVGAKFAISDGAFAHLIFHDVDIIPVKNVDYLPRDYNVAWFMSAGTCKIHTGAYTSANGYNPHFVGWGDEDTEFYHRLSTMHLEVKEWHKTDEARDAVMVNLEWPTMSESEALNWSSAYFGHDGVGPRFVPYGLGGRRITRYDKSQDFLSDGHWRGNSKLWESVREMPAATKIPYIQQNGMNLVNLTKVVIKKRISNLVWLTYETPDVLN